jgi:predicted CopG family antitoxin
MSTTIQIDESIRDSLNAMKIHSRETYSDVIHRLLEDQRELSDETKREIEKAVKEIESGKYRTHDEVKEELGL